MKLDSEKAYAMPLIMGPAFDRDAAQALVPDCYLVPEEATAQERINSSPWLGYKYVESFDGPPDASYPMVVWNEVEIDELWLGNGASVEFGHTDEEDLDIQAGITRALGHGG